MPRSPGGTYAGERRRGRLRHRRESAAEQSSYPFLSLSVRSAPSPRLIFCTAVSYGTHLAPACIWPIEEAETNIAFPSSRAERRMSVVEGSVAVWTLPTIYSRSLDCARDDVGLNAQYSSRTIRLRKASNRNDSAR